MSKRAVHPGEILQEELEELGVTPTALARDIGVPANRISQIIAGKRAITGDTALRLGHWFGVSPQFWMNLQSAYDLATADSLAGGKIRDLPTAAYRAESSSGEKHGIVDNADIESTGSGVELARPVAVEARGKYRIWVKFLDGVEGEVDLSDCAGIGVFKAWDDPGCFESVHLGPARSIAWNDQIDLCSDSLYMEVTGISPEDYLSGVRAS